MQRLDLTGSWQFRGVNRRAAATRADVSEWMPATVPGTVHTDLPAQGKIPDPFYRMNELEVQWVDAERWMYRKEFAVDQELLVHDSVALMAEGLDTFAEITLNGRRIGQSANMLVEHRFEVKQFLRVGKNILEVLFDSPTMRARKLEDQYGKLIVSHESPRVYARKAQYSFGWDWGPKLATSGIWRPIYLEAYSDCRIASVFVRTLKLTRALAVLRVDVELERRNRRAVEIALKISGGGFEYGKTFRVAGAKKSVTIRLPHPHFWWPNGYGEQPLYQIDVTATSGQSICDMKSASFGIRTVRLLQERDSEGKSFVVEVNGTKIYCKGADWIPSDNFIPRIAGSTYERLLTLARDAHMNMVRVWGGGIYEEEVFYQLCDRLGLMVWQDFMFACAEYPEDRWFLEQVREEAEKVVTRLRNHPSIVLWCGNNECEWNFCKENPGQKPDGMRGARIFRDLLPSICRTLDGTRPYWRSSPFGEGFPNDESNGNRHQWEVWGLWKDYREYESDTGRFVTEFGFQAPASMRTMESATLTEDRYPQSSVLEHHNKLPEGTERLFRFQAAHYEVSGDMEDFVYKGQIVQAEALKTAVEHWRRRKFKTAGSLFWQLNDCWPVCSWSVIDSGLRPKAAYYYARRFFAPVLVSFRKTEHGVQVWVTNDRLAAFHGELAVHLLQFNGAEGWALRKSIRVQPNQSRIVLLIRNQQISGADPIQSYLRASLANEAGRISENRYFFLEPKHMKGETAGLEASISSAGAREYHVLVVSQSFARHVRLEVVGRDAEFEDNYFDVDPGVTKTIKLLTDIPLEQLRSALKVRSLWSRQKE